MTNRTSSLIAAVLVILFTAVAPVYVVASPLTCSSLLWIEQQIDDSLAETAEFARDSPMARQNGGVFFPLLDSVFQGQLKSETLTPIRLLGGGLEGLVFLVQREDRTLAALKFFREKHYHDSFLHHMEIVRENAVSILDFNPNGLRPVLMTYKRGITVEQLAIRWELIGMSESEYQKIRQDFTRLKEKYDGKESKLWISEANVIYSFEESRLYIIDPY